ncbi:general amidase [Neolentinus lepideus HHB14362 ss-1]|uniref:amidase n=1 Tax=Neolentinus lepideus HHB14362 ss-1 TaxID=1314782 RepID=A0A165VZ51_9AGAM|nr:general amidase [Neolentinus lepideus HHB14362 ss-1]
MSSWQTLVADKKKRQQESIPQEWIVSPPPDDVLNVTGFPGQSGLLSAKELQITNEVDVQVLLQKLASGEWSSVEVTTAFYKRAILAQQVTNCVTEIFVERALKRASELDAHLREKRTVVGPLHGLPISLKDQLCVEGLETTIGYVSLIGNYAKKNAVLVDILLEAGAVPFVRTNVPQTLMWGETFNNVFGRTTNPYNRTLTCGGSSGGEGALIALKGSPLGVGSDIGGSIRIPASFCGIYGMRPSYHRVPYEGALNTLQGEDSVPSVFGPLSNSISGIKAFMKAVIDLEPWKKDPLAVRKHWDHEAYQLSEHGEGKCLCFGIMWDDGNIVPHPPVLRGLTMIKDALVNAGHIVKDWKPINHKEMNDTAVAIWGAAAREDFRMTTLSTEEPIIATMLPESNAFSEAAVDTRYPQEGISSYQLWQLHKRKIELRKEYLDHWEKTAQDTGTGRPVDAIIAPVAPYVAPPHGKNRPAGYTRVYNLLDYPVIILPVSQVDQELDVKVPPHEYLNDADREFHQWYDPALVRDAPITLQLIGRTLDEEALVALAEIVDAALRSQYTGDVKACNLHDSLPTTGHEAL